MPEKPATEFVIHYKSKNNDSYFKAWTAIGPAFGATAETAMRFATEQDARMAKVRMPSSASLFCDIEPAPGAQRAA